MTDHTSFSRRLQLYEIAVAQAVKEIAAAQAPRGIGVDESTGRNKQAPAPAATPTIEGTLSCEPTKFQTDLPVATPTPALPVTAEDREIIIQRLERELAAYQKAAPLCDKHKPSDGARSGCVVCGLIELSSALSQIDYLCGEPNEMRVSGYDVHCEPLAVVERVKIKMAELAAEHEMHISNVAYLIQKHDTSLAALAETRKECCGQFNTCVPAFPDYCVPQLQHQLTAARDALSYAVEHNSMYLQKHTYAVEAAIDAAKEQTK